MLGDCFRIESDEARAKDHRLDPLLQTPFWDRVRFYFSGLDGCVVYNREQHILEYVKNNLIAADQWNVESVQQLADFLCKRDDKKGCSLLEWTAMGRPNLSLGVILIAEKLKEVTKQTVSVPINPFIFKIRVPTSSELERIFR